jgi:hypothetical protein
VLSALYDLPRPTGDADYIAAMPSSSLTSYRNVPKIQSVLPADGFRTSSSGSVSLHWKCIISFSPSWSGTAQLTSRMPGFSPGQDGSPKTFSNSDTRRNYDRTSQMKSGMILR